MSFTLDSKALVSAVNKQAARAREEAQRPEERLEALHSRFQVIKRRLEERLYSSGAVARKGRVWADAILTYPASEGCTGSVLSKCGPQVAEIQELQAIAQGLLEFKFPNIGTSSQTEGYQTPYYATVFSRLVCDLYNTLIFAIGVHPNFLGISREQATTRYTFEMLPHPQGTAHSHATALGRTIQGRGYPYFVNRGEVSWRDEEDSVYEPPTVASLTRVVGGPPIEPTTPFKRWAAIIERHSMGAVRRMGDRIPDWEDKFPHAVRGYGMGAVGGMDMALSSPFFPSVEKEGAWWKRSILAEDGRSESLLKLTQYKATTGFSFKRLKEGVPPVDPAMMYGRLQYRQSIWGRRAQYLYSTTWGSILDVRPARTPVQTGVVKEEHNRFRLARTWYLGAPAPWRSVPMRPYSVPRVGLVSSSVDVGIYRYYKSFWSAPDINLAAARSTDDLLFLRVAEPGGALDHWKESAYWVTKHPKKTIQELQALLVDISEWDVATDIENAFLFYMNNYMPYWVTVARHAGVPGAEDVSYEDLDLFLEAYDRISENAKAEGLAPLQAITTSFASMAATIAGGIPGAIAAVGLMVVNLIAGALTPKLDVPPVYPMGLFLRTPGAYDCTFSPEQGIKTGVFNTGLTFFPHLVPDEEDELPKTDNTLLLLLAAGAGLLLLRKK